VPRRTYKIPHERLSATDIRRRFPQFRVADHEEGYFEPSAGYLHVEACIETQLELAKDRYGAELHTDTPIERYRAVSDGIEVITTLRGDLPGGPASRQCRRVAAEAGQTRSTL
jgi:sarcosine oxidase